jgi:hypothetical protein
MKAMPQLRMLQRKLRLHWQVPRQGLQKLRRLLSPVNKLLQPLAIKFNKD